MTYGAELRATEYGQVGLEFARALVADQYAVAYAMLSIDLRKKWSPQKLKDKFERMAMRAQCDVTEIEVEEGYDDYPNKPEGDIGGVYVHLRLQDRNDQLLGYNEAVMVFVLREADGPRIREIIWGRP